MTNNRSRGVWTVVLTSAAFFIVALDALVVVTALPAIHRDLAASESMLQWTVNAYSLAFAAGIITAAAIGDRFGRRRVYVVGLLLFSVASAGCALAPSAGFLVAARAVQGMGAAVVTPLSLTILTGAFPARRRGALIGIWGGIAGLAVAGGPLVGGAVTQGLSWQWIFWISVPIGLVAAGLSAVRLPESHGPLRRLDLPGVALASAGFAALAWGLLRGADAGWGGVESVGVEAMGAVLLYGFVAWERRAAEPVLPLRLLRMRSFAAAGVTTLLMSAAIFSAAFLVSQYFQLVLGYSPLATGLRFLPWTATPLLIAPAAGALSDRIGPRPLMVAGMLLQGAGLAWVALVATEGSGYGPLVLPLVIAGIGVSMVLPTAPAAALASVDPADLGLASGVTNTLQRFGGFIGTAAVAAVFASNGHLGTPASVDAGLRPALALSAGLSVLGALAAMAATGRIRRPDDATPAPAPLPAGSAR